MFNLVATEFTTRTFKRMRYGETVAILKRFLHSNRRNFVVVVVAAFVVVTLNLALKYHLKGP